MVSAVEELDVELQAHAGLAFDERPRFGTRRSTRPLQTRLPSRQTVGGLPFEVDLVGCSTAHTGMGAVFVVPTDDRPQLSPKLLATQRDERQSTAERFEGEYGSFDDRNGALLADGAESWLDPFTPAPRLEAVGPELGSLITHKIFGPGLDGGHGAPEERSHGLRGGFLSEDRKAHNSA